MQATKLGRQHFIDWRGNDGLNAYLVAARAGRVSILTALDAMQHAGMPGQHRQHRRNPCGEKSTALHEAAAHAKVEATVYLMGIDPGLAHEQDGFSRLPAERAQQPHENSSPERRKSLQTILMHLQGFPQTGSLVPPEHLPGMFASLCMFC